MTDTRTGTQEDQVARRHCGANGVDGNEKVRACTMPPGHTDPHQVRDSPGTPTGEALWRWSDGEVLRRYVPARLTDSRVDIAEPGLDAAWAEAEAALPKGHVLAEVRRFDNDTERWGASTDNVTDVGRYHYSGEGDTPAAALRALAARLRENQP